MGAYNINVIWVTLVIVFGSSFQFGYSISVLNLLRNYIVDLYSATKINRYADYDVGHYTGESSAIFQTTTALLILGGVIGAFLGGFLADRIGRKNSILLSHVFVVAGIALMTCCVWVESMEMIMIGRILVGVNTGIGNAIVPTFLSEMALPRARGAINTMHQLFITFGILMGNVFGIREIFGTSQLWQYAFLVMVAPVVVSLAAMKCFPESPRYLLLVRRDEEAGRESLKFYRRSKNVEDELKEIVEEGERDAKMKKEEFRTCSLFGRDLRRATLIACGLQVVQQLSGINAVMFYSSDIYLKANVSPDNIQYAVIGTSAVNMAMTVIAVSLSDTVGRRKLLIIPMIIMIIVFAVLTVALVYVDTYSEIAYVAIACILIYIICFAVGLGPIPMMIASEMFRQEPRPKAMMVSGWTNWTFTFIVAMVFEHVNELCHPFTFIIFIILLLLFVFLCCMFVPETKNRTFNSIAAELGASPKIESSASQAALEPHEDNSDELVGDDDEDDDEEGGKGKIDRASSPIRNVSTTSSIANFLRFLGRKPPQMVTTATQVRTAKKSSLKKAEEKQQDGETGGHEDGEDTEQGEEADDTRKIHGTKSVTIREN